MDVLRMMRCLTRVGYYRKHSVSLESPWCASGQCRLVCSIFSAFKFDQHIIDQKYTLCKVIMRNATTVATDNHVLSLDAKPFKEIPGPRGKYNIPYIGTAFHFKPFTKYLPSDYLTILENMRDNYGDILKMRVGRDYVVYVFHPDYAKKIFQLPYKEHKRVSLEIMNVFFKRTGLQKPLALLEGEEWSALRKPTQEKMLRPAVVASYVPLIEKVTNDFIELLSHKDKIDDLQKCLMNYAFESVGMLCFNKRLGCFDSKTTPEMVKHTQEFFKATGESLVMPIKTFKLFKTDLYKKFASARFEMTRITKEELAKQRQVLAILEKEGKLEEYLESEPNFMYSLLNDPRMSDDKVDSIVTSLLGAGIDSTSNSMVFAITDLALHPDKQNKLYEEIKTVVGDSKQLTNEHLSKMHYLKACVKESQRKTFPIMIGAPRTLEEDIVLGGYTIPKNTFVHPNMSAMSLDERFFPRPKEYIPERWLRGTNDPITKGQEFPFGMKPFGFGPRGCIGQRFAEMEIYINITKIIQSFEVSLPPGVTEVKPVFSTFTAPADKVVLHLRKR